MAFSARFELKHTQSLVMTPQLQQAIKLLTLSNMELAAYVDDQIESNPLLELAEPEKNEAAISVDLSVEQNTGLVGLGDGDALGYADDVIQTDGLSVDKQESLDADFSILYAEDSSAESMGTNAQGTGEDWSITTLGSPGTSTSGAYDADHNMEAVLSDFPTLRQHLTGQLGNLRLNFAENSIAEYLIDSVNEAGYLNESLDEISIRLNADRSQLDSILHQLQELEPAGVFARDLAECLALQLRERNRYDPAMARLLENLDLVAKRAHVKLVEICGVDVEDIIEMIEEVRRLDPKPGHMFAREIAETLIPDVYVLPNDDGGWKVELNSETLPKVLVNNNYYTEVTQKAKDKGVKEYISECYADANWLMKSLDQRAKTILKVAAEVVRQQSEFLENGVHYLKPLNLKTVGDAIGMHESTISRVTTNKYVATERGIFEMKYFFTTAISSSQGDAGHSAESVRYRIKKLIDEEKASDILSDDKIVEILRADDVDIARRTVAKYREMLKIPSSIQRRRAKKALQLAMRKPIRRNPYADMAANEYAFEEAPQVKVSA